MLCCYFEAYNVKKKKYTKNIMPVIDEAMFHNYVHVCKQLFLCDVIRSCANLLTTFLRVSHLTRRERKDMKD